MAWIRNLISRPGNPSSDDAEAGVPSHPDAVGARPPSPPGSPEPELELELGTGLLPPTTHMTGHQFFYIFIMDGIIAMILSGGINFAVAYAMYTTQDLEAHPIRLFQLPNTLAGDAGVTIIIQCLITWLAEFFLVGRDLRHGTVAPAAFLPEPKGPVARWFLLLDGADARSAVAHVLRAMLIAVASFIVMWGPAVGILTAVGTRSGGDWVFEAKWAPQVFKLMFGGVLSLLTTPPLAMFWLLKAGWSAPEVADAEGGDSPEP